LFDLVLKDAYVNRESAPTRRVWLEKMQGEKFIPLLMKCWQQNVQTLVPDPASPSSKSSYEYHARWLVVVNEINPAACRALIKSWQTEHHRRGNLWKAIKAVNLPVG
jgi:hypothetical protein